MLVLGAHMISKYRCYLGSLYESGAQKRPRIEGFIWETSVIYGKRGDVPQCYRTSLACGKPCVQSPSLRGEKKKEREKAVIDVSRSLSSMCETLSSISSTGGQRRGSNLNYLCRNLFS